MGVCGYMLIILNCILYLTSNIHLVKLHIFPLSASWYFSSNSFSKSADIFWCSKLCTQDTLSLNSLMKLLLNFCYWEILLLHLWILLYLHFLLLSRNGIPIYFIFEFPYEILTYVLKWGFPVKWRYTFPVNFWILLQNLHLNFAI